GQQIDHLRRRFRRQQLSPALGGQVFEQRVIRSQLHHLLPLGGQDRKRGPQLARFPVWARRRGQLVRQGRDDQLNFVLAGQKVVDLAFQQARLRSVGLERNQGDSFLPSVTLTRLEDAGGDQSVGGQKGYFLSQADHDVHVLARLVGGLPRAEA